jgi:hypothetical protein
VPQARIDRYPPELAAQYRQISACVSRPVYGIVTHTDRYDEGGTEYGVVSDNTLELLNKDTHRAAIRQIDDHELLEYFLQFIHPTEADEIREAWFSDRDWHEIAREHGLAYKTKCMRMRITLIKLQLIGKAYNEGAHIPYFKPRRDIAPHVLQDSWCRGKLLRYAPKKHVVSQKSGLVECTKQKGKKKRKKKAYTLALDVPLASCDGSKPQRVRLRFV